MNIVQRYKMRRAWRDAAKEWRRLGFGTMRFVWRIDGARAEFSAPDVKDLNGLIQVLDEYVNVLRAVRDRKVQQVPSNSGD